MKVLVTGGCGFIGSHLTDRLVEKGFDVRIIDNLEYQVHQGTVPDYLNPEAECIYDDIANEEALKTAIKGVSVIFHLAAAVGVGQSMYQVNKYVNSNTMATAKLLDLLVNETHDVKKLIVASSMSIYGEGTYECQQCGVVYPTLRQPEQFKRHEWEMKCPLCGNTTKPIPTREDKPLYPTSIYAITKRDQEEMCLTIGRSYNIPTVALRYFNVYGPRQSLSNPYTGVAAIFSSRIKNNNPPLIFEDGLQCRDFISVYDIIQANLLAMDKEEADYESFNVGTGKVTSILDIANILATLYGSNVKPQIVGKYRIGDIRHCFADITKIQKLGFKPQVDLASGIAELVTWGNPVQANDRVDQAIKELKDKGLVEV